METLWQDVKYGIRMLRKSLGFTLVAVLTLALGISANTAIFSVVDALLLRPLPFRDPERLVVVWGTRPEVGREEASLPDFADWRAQNETFESLAAGTTQNVTLTGQEEPERLIAGVMTDNFLPVLGVQPILGRSFLPEEDRPGGPRAAILSYGLWQRRFGGDRGVLSRTIMIDGQGYTIVGVAPAHMELPPGAELWVPLARDPAQAGRRNDFLFVVGRLKPGVTIQQANADLNTIMARLEKEYPDTNTSWRTEVITLQEQLVGQVRPALLVLLGAVGFVLLIACTNVANLLLARAAVREREVAVRAALGASRARLVQALLTESVLLGLLGGGLGVIAAFWGVDVLLGTASADLPPVNQVEINPRVLGFTALLSLLTGLLFGLAPALQLTRPDLNEALKEGSRGTGTGTGRRNLRRLLVVSQMALSFVLLIGAGLTIRSLHRLMNVQPGFNREGLLTMQVPLSRTKYAERQQLSAVYERLLERLRGIPGVRTATLTNPVPLSGGMRFWSFRIAGRPAPAPEVQQDANILLVGGSYMEVMGIPKLQGRGFSPQDIQRPEVAVISRAFARRYFSNQDPIGHRLTFGDPASPNAQWLTIVGVAEDVRHTALERETYPTIYVPYSALSAANMALVVRASGDPMALASTLRGVVREIDPEVAVYAVRTMDQVLGNALRQPRSAMVLLSIFALVALVLAGVGVYGVMAYLVEQRTHEFGIRMALGAQGGNILALVLREAILLAAFGLGAGLAGALVLTRYLGNLIFGVPPNDLLTFSLVGLVMVSMALIACLVPARRATRVDPVVALRYE